MYGLDLSRNSTFYRQSLENLADDTTHSYSIQVVYPWYSAFWRLLEWNTKCKDEIRGVYIKSTGMCDPPL
jgi:hypothetical protein